MKKKSVIYKILITFSSITAILLILIGMVLSAWINRDYSILRSERISKYMEIIQGSTEEFLNENSETGYEDLKSTMKIIKASVDMDSIILDNQGYVYAISDERFEDLMYNKIDMNDSDLKRLKSGKMIEKSFFDKNNKRFKTYTTPLFNGESFNGIIIVFENSESTDFSKKLYSVIWISVLGAVVLSSVVAYYFSQKILISPLSEINNAAKKLAKGEVEKRVYIDSDDEIGELANSFNIMAESLEKVDNVRREFISNVSHELRSPITSIKGFITGIVDGVIPKDKENYYLNIVNDEVSRLSRLVNDLLDISTMESGKFKLKVAKLDINEIITLCTLNLEGKINEKKIRVEVIFNDSYEYCIGDRDRIIQVVTNLLENAIKYGDEGGRIQVETYAKGDFVYISIFNSGPNIPKEDINKIWERFYKMDKARTNKISTGLGLSIVRLILSQHNQDIWVNNIEGKGVKFTFTLKRSIK
ncbi:HAMP domain-containing sensor histidine kinase [Clostridium tertium]|uniref:sensor histidine kinase n=1 Tax=Clostridium tertium TaxID=1559 RepID=UPI00115847B9|nr:HAMP domain-containing sensor histidine kinase [Clostridium tertium]MDB1954711.1 HAMP domain-containing sensor histidine kinase [Clostridium tertium]MDB1958182.1 HAMP domain-containing sensor histidine kinase [Clostridium tertium]MDB1962277.1 HAMP domain-containing sensor histidine kinase [Clostridium tertium]MDB1966516.1 HAMP domain-containing sensor histidine kinase [Clostridium tertium]